MIHVLMDDGEFIGLIANLDTATVVEATRLVDKAFQHAVDYAPAEDLELAICHHIDLRYDRSMLDWHDVLLAYLVKLGGTLVEYYEVECVPPRKSAGRKE